jgi:protein-L-isoaspartate(D-aspartate) O-methyltransferase
VGPKHVTMKCLNQQPSERCRRLLQQIKAEMAEIGSWYGQQSLDPHVLDAIARVPREAFVPPDEAPRAYANIPLPIGYGQTISQPFIVAVMTDLLQPKADHVILEVGTGSGYQAAVLGQLVKQVYSLEVVGALAEQARLRLAHLGCTNVEVRHADGYEGWSEHAPFDGIIVTAAAPFVPPPLVQQLKPGGRMVIPVDTGIEGQSLMLLERHASGQVTSRNMLPVAFVPLTRGAIA